MTMLHEAPKPHWRDDGGARDGGRSGAIAVRKHELGLECIPKRCLLEGRDAYINISTHLDLLLLKTDVRCTWMHLLSTGWLVHSRHPNASDKHARKAWNPCSKKHNTYKIQCEKETHAMNTTYNGTTC